jgi:hypothetical protein
MEHTRGLETSPPARDTLDVAGGVGVLEAAGPATAVRRPPARIAPPHVPGRSDAKVTPSWSSHLVSIVACGSLCLLRSQARERRVAGSAKEERCR